MYKNVLQSIDNVAIWPVVSFVIFFIFFLCLLWWVFTTDKKVLKELENLPLNDGKVSAITNSNAEKI
jgi:cytochrome c oxidase cbb3-type subunit IV